MNTAARIESNGERDRIHVSNETAKLLIAAGKSKWLTKRDDAIYAKGKGMLETYWLNLERGLTATPSYGENAGAGNSVETSCASLDAESYDNSKPGDFQKKMRTLDLPIKTHRLVEWNSSVLVAKLKEIVAQRKPCLSCLPPEVPVQIMLYVTEVAKRYNQNPFHNFEHVSLSLALDSCSASARIL